MYIYVYNLNFWFPQKTSITHIRPSQIAIKLFSCAGIGSMSTSRAIHNYSMVVVVWCGVVWCVEKRRVRIQNYENLVLFSSNRKRERD